MENKAIENFQQNNQNCTDQLHSKVGNSTILYSQRQKTFLVPPSQQKEGQVVISYNFDNTTENSGCTHNILIGWDNQPTKMVTKKTKKSNQSKAPFRKKVIEVNKILQENEDLLNDNERVPLSKLNPNKTMPKFRHGHSEPKDKILPNSISGHVPVSRSLYKNKISSSSTKISKYDNQNNKKQNYPIIKGTQTKHQFNGDKLFKVPHENKLTAQRKQFRNGKTIETSNYASPSGKLPTNQPNKIFNRCPQINLNRDVEGPSLFPSDQEEINDNQKHGIETLKLIEQLEKLSDSQQINQNDNNTRNIVNTLQQPRDNPTREITRNKKFQTSYETDSNKTCQLKESNCRTNKLSNLSEIAEEDNKCYVRKRNNFQGKSAQYRKNKLFSNKEQPLTKADDRSNSSFQAQGHVEKKKVIKRLQETKKVALTNKTVDPQRKVKIKSTSKEQKQSSNLNKRSEKSQHKTEESHLINEISKISEENSSAYDIVNNRNSNNKNEEEVITNQGKRNEDKRKPQTSRPGQSVNFRKTCDKKQQKIVGDKSKADTRSKKESKKGDGFEQNRFQNNENELSQQEQFNTFKPELYKQQSRNKKSTSSLFCHNNCVQEKNKSEIEPITQKDGKTKNKQSQKKENKNSKEKLMSNKSKNTSLTNKQVDQKMSHRADQRSIKDRKLINCKPNSKQKSENNQQKQMKIQQMNHSIDHQRSYEQKEDKMRESSNKKAENGSRNRNKSNGISNTVDKINKYQQQKSDNSLANRSQEQSDRQKLQRTQPERQLCQKHKNNPAANKKIIEQAHRNQEQQKLYEAKGERQQCNQYKINPSINKRINEDKMEVQTDRRSDRNDKIQSDNHNKEKFKKTQINNKTDDDKLKKNEDNQLQEYKQESQGMKQDDERGKQKISFERNQIQQIIQKKTDQFQEKQTKQKNQQTLNKDLVDHSIGKKDPQNLAEVQQSNQLNHKNIGYQNSKNRIYTNPEAHQKKNFDQHIKHNQRSGSPLQTQYISQHNTKQCKKEQFKQLSRDFSQNQPKQRDHYEQDQQEHQCDLTKSVCKQSKGSMKNSDMPSQQSKKNGTVNKQQTQKYKEIKDEENKQNYIPPIKMKDDNDDARNDVADKSTPHKPNGDGSRNNIPSKNSSRNKKNAEKNPLSKKTIPSPKQSHSNIKKQPEKNKLLKKSNKTESQTKIRNSKRSSGHNHKIGSLNNCNTKQNKNQNIRISISSGRNTGRSSKTPTVITCKAKEEFQEQILDQINPIQSSQQSQISELENRDQQPPQQAPPKQNTKEQRKKEEVMKNLMKPINVEEKKERNRDKDDSVHSEWANLSCEANLYPIKEESVFDAIRQRKLNQTDMMGLSPNHKQRKLNNNNVLWDFNEESKNRESYERAPILSLIYGNALKKINQLKLANNSYSYAPSEELSDLQQISQNSYGISDIWDQWQPKKKGQNIDCFQRAVCIIMQVDSWLIDRIIEPYISKKGKNQGWLYCQGYWRPFIDHQNCNILKFLRNILENAAQTFYGINDGDINKLGIQQIIRMVTGLRVMQLHNKKKSLQQIQFNLKKGHIIKGITKDMRKPFIYRILDLKKTIQKQTNKQIKLIQVQKHNIFSEDRKPEISLHEVNKAQTIHSNINSYIAQNSNENVNWVRQQSLGKYFQYFLLINYRNDSFWTAQALKKQPHNVSVYTLDALRETAGSLEIHASANVTAKIEFYREVKPRVLKLVGKINQKNKNMGIRSANSPNPSLYFDFKVKGKYYVFIEYDQDDSQQSSHDADIAFESSEPLVISFLEKIKKSSLKNQHSEYVSVQAKESNKVKGLSIPSSLSIKEEFIKYLMGTQTK